MIKSFTVNTPLPSPSENAEKISCSNAYRLEVNYLRGHELRSSEQYLKFLLGFEASSQSKIDYLDSIPSSVDAQYILGLKVKTRFYYWLIADDWLIDDLGYFTPALTLSKRHAPNLSGGKGAGYLTRPPPPPPFKQFILSCAMCSFVQKYFFQVILPHLDGTCCHLLEFDLYI